MIFMFLQKFEKYVSFKIYIWEMSKTISEEVRHKLEVSYL